MDTEYLTSAHDFSKHANISRHSGTIPSLVFKLMLTFLHSELCTFSNADHDIRVLSAELPLVVNQADNVIAHDFRTQCKHLRHKPGDQANKQINFCFSQPQVTEFTDINSVNCEQFLERISRYSHNLLKVEVVGRNLPPVRCRKDRKCKQNKTEKPNIADLHRKLFQAVFLARAIINNVVCPRRVQAIKTAVCAI